MNDLDRIRGLLETVAVDLDEKDQKVDSQQKEITALIKENEVMIKEMKEMEEVITKLEEQMGHCLNCKALLDLKK